MEPKRWRLIEEHFDAALALSRDRRGAYIARVAHGDPELRIELEGLLRASERASTFLEEPPPMSTGGMSLAQALAEGSRLGAWRIVRLIGHGGMGEVYEVERADGQFEQRAALKLTRPESAKLLDRFNAERQILARLDHPGIVRLLDGGVAPDGRPYAVMEYVEGQVISEYCQARHTTLNERLALFLQVCEAVAHAHVNLIVHRDIKPGNVLVDAGGRTRLLDFGIAKPLDVGVWPGAASAEITAALLTPDYAAPEQLSGEPVTTATDVYALGVLLFELLVGRRPWITAGRPLVQALNSVLESAAPAASQTAASSESAPVPARLLQGDLDAIIAKCLRREPQHRYTTVNALKFDIERSLKGDPVLAREDAKLYVFGRFVRRYRWVAVAVAAIIASLAAGLIGVRWQAERAALERDIARRAASREEAVRYHLIGLFRAAVETPGKEPVTAKTMFDHSARRVIEQYGDDPHLTSKVVETLADLYGALGDTEAQAPLLEQFLALADGPRGADADPVSVATARHKLAGIEIWRGNLARAEPLLEQAEAFWAAAPDRYREQRLEAALIRGQLQRAQGHMDAAIETLGKAVRERIALSGRDHRETATLYNSLAITFAAVNRVDDALAAYNEALAIHERLGRSNEPDALVMLANTGTLALRAGRLAEAERILESAVQRQQATAGDSAAVAAAMGLYGVALTMRAQFTEALDILRKAAAMAEQFGGATSPVAVQNRLFLAEALGSAGQGDAAHSLLDRNLAIARERFGDGHLMTLRIRLAQIKRAFTSGQHHAVPGQLADLIAGLRKLGPPGEATLAQALVLAGDVSIAGSRPREAIAPLEEAVRLRERLLWSASWELAESRARLGEARLASGDAQGAMLLTAATEALRAELGEAHPQVVRAKHVLARSL